MLKKLLSVFLLFSFIFLFSLLLKNDAKAATCASSGGSCAASGVCNAEGRIVAGTGCTAPSICCIFTETYDCSSSKVCTRHTTVGSVGPYSSLSTCNRDCIYATTPPSAPPTFDINGCSATVRLANGSLVSTPTLSCIFPLIANIISWALEFSGIVAVIFIIYSGIRLIFSGGDPKSIEGARKILIYAILGLVLIFLSFMMVRFISQVSGVSCIDPSKPLSFTVCQ